MAGALALNFTASGTPYTANSINFTNTAATTMIGVGGGANLDIGAGGITTGTGAVTIGQNSGTGVNMSLSAIQTWNVGPGGLTVSNNISDGNAFTKTGSGTFTLNSGGAGSFGGGITVNAGIMNLDFVNLGATANLVASGSSLALGGGTLNIKGNSANNSSQTLGNVTLNVGGGQILVNPYGAARTATLTLGALPYTVATGSSAGSSLVIGTSLAALGTVAITTTTNKDATGIYGGRIVFANGTANTGYNWATTVSAGPAFTLSAYSGYTTMVVGATSDALNDRWWERASRSPARTRITPSNSKAPRERWHSEPT